MSAYRTYIALLLLFLVLIGSFIPKTGRACDTWVALPDATESGYTILGKNSDRVDFDCQPLFLYPRKQWPGDAVVDLGRVKIPQVGETYATLGSSPYWCWGYEEGINEYGVAIGNEGIRTKVFLEELESHRRHGDPAPGPTGMDLIRLGLERGKTAYEALQVICALLDEYGQFGSGLPSLPAVIGGYHNSFIIADPREAWILETAGKHWVARRIDRGTASISNTISITTDWDLLSSDLESHARERGWWEGDPSAVFDFTKAYLDQSPTGAEQCKMSLPRAACSAGLLAQKQGLIDLRWMMGIGRDRSSTPTIDRDNTASSCVALLPKSSQSLPVFWWCPGMPSAGCYIPFFVHGSRLPEIVSKTGTFGRRILPPSEADRDRFSEDSYWWRSRALADQVRVDYENRNPIVRAGFDTLEKEFEIRLPEVVRKAMTLRSEGKMSEAAGVLDAFSADCLDKVLEKTDSLRKRFSEQAKTDFLKTGKGGGQEDPDRELTDRFDRLAAQLEEKRIELHIPGMALAVVRDDEVVLARGFGMADLENAVPVTAGTLFAVGSTTKAFTATLIGMLADEGLMDWDDPVTRYLPGFKLPVDSEDKNAQVVIRDLLSHRTGFTRMTMLFANGAVPGDEILNTATNAKPWSPFRRNFHYNNVMFLAAGTAAARAAGKDWSALIAERILEPLGMDETQTDMAALMTDPRLSKGYEWDEALGDYKIVPHRPLGNIAPAGAINSTALDMARWVRFLLNHGVVDGKRLISRKNLEETWKEQIRISGDAGYGLGWIAHSWNGLSVLSHGGNIDGFAAEVALLPDADLGFVLLMNVTASLMQQISVNMVWEALLGEVEETEESLDYSPYLGNYIANFGQFVDREYEVIVKDGRLAVDVPNQRIYKLKNPDEQGRWFFALTDQIAVSFVRNEEGEVVAMKQYQSGMELELPRAGVEIPPEVPLERIRKYLGNYRSESLNEIVS
ncbi:MAG: serine hydrolase, partial [Planctomycetes bacterium]|nr:serine hydrolase [Planctomycetota bacterium]